jgi:hypothetical protein
MRTVAIVAVLLALAANASAFLPAAGQYQQYVPAAAIALGVIAVIAIAAIRARPAPRPVAEAARPAAAPPPAQQAEAEVIGFLGALQAKGRLVDFLMDDINAHNDAQVGAAARVVHAGCKAVLADAFRISPVRTEGEGTRVTVPAGYAADEYRLVGKIGGQAPFTGTLIHHGWKTETVKLPRVVRSGGDRLPAIAPAEVELA